MILPTLSVAAWLTWKARECRTEFIHNLAVVWWLCANAVWMIGEFFFNDGTRHIAMAFFATGSVCLVVQGVREVVIDFVSVKSGVEATHLLF